MNWAQERIASSIAVDDGTGCWVWMGALTDKGYGRIHAGGKTQRAHRFSYEAFVGPIPSGLTIDHLCRNRACVAPGHLEPVTQAENLRRSSVVITTINAGKTECRNGHSYDEANTYYAPNGSRRCITCRNEGLARHYSRRRAS